MKDSRVNAKADKKILAAEQKYSAVLGHKFHIPLITDYIEWLTNAGSENIQVAEHFSEPNFLEMIKHAGGWKVSSKLLELCLN